MSIFSGCNTKPISLLDDKGLGGQEFKDEAHWPDGHLDHQEQLFIVCQDETLQRNVEYDEKENKLAEAEEKVKPFPRDEK